MAACSSGDGGRPKKLRKKKLNGGLEPAALSEFFGKPGLSVGKHELNLTVHKHEGLRNATLPT